MRKRFRVAAILDVAQVGDMDKILTLSFGRENVITSVHPQELQGILRRLKPTTLLMDPELFRDCGILPQDLLEQQKKGRFHILLVCPTERSVQAKFHYNILKISAEFLFPTNLLGIAEKIPQLSTNDYTYRTAPLQEETAKNISALFRDCGFRCNLKGAPLLTEALAYLYVNPDLHRHTGCKTIYEKLAAEHRISPRVAERSMLRFLESSWSADTENALRTKLSIPEFYDFTPLSFKRFTEIFNTYYTIKYGSPKDRMAQRKKTES